MEITQIPIKIQREIDKLLSLSTDYTNKTVGIHEMEKGLLAQLLCLGLSLLSYIIAEKKKQMKDYKPIFSPDQSYESKGAKSRRYLSLFGELSFCRIAYWSSGLGLFYKLDEHLQLPQGTYWSYNLQELVGENASENDYEESVHLINKILNLGLSGKSSERNINRIGCNVDAFYDLEVPVQEEEELHFSASFDGKGVPKIKPAKVVAGNPKARLGKGAKKGTKQMATVSVISSFKAKKQKVDWIIHTLMGCGLSKVDLDEKAKAHQQNQNDNRWHKNIHRRAFLDDQQKGVDYGMSNIKDRMTNPNSRFVVPIDAGPGLEKQVLASIKKYGLTDQFEGIILDIIHVSEYVWNAATAIFGEKSALRANWVRAILTEILNSQTGQVIEELKDHIHKTRLSQNKKDQINKAITYFTNHQHKMDYKKFIENGYPVSSALVESACGHLVKQRMEQSGMRWSSNGAQNMMDMRAVKHNDHISYFMDFVIQKDRKVRLTKIAA